MKAMQQFAHYLDTVHLPTPHTMWNWITGKSIELVME